MCVVVRPFQSGGLLSKTVCELLTAYVQSLCSSDKRAQSHGTDHSLTLQDRKARHEELRANYSVSLPLLELKPRSAPAVAFLFSPLQLPSLNSQYLSTVYPKVE